MSSTPQPTDPTRACECCEERFPDATPGWYVDPEGVELCPGCTDDLRAEWSSLSNEERTRFA